MNKKVIFVISVAVNTILAGCLALLIYKAGSELSFEYAVQDTIRPDSIESYLERENYGIAASLSQDIRGGAVIKEEYRERYMLGEYADILFLKEISERSGDTDTVASFENRLQTIRAELPGSGAVLDKIDRSVKKAIRSE